MTEVITPVSIINTWAKANAEKVDGICIDEEFDISHYLNGDTNFPMLAFMAFNGLRLEADAVHYDVEKFPIIVAMLDALNVEFEPIARQEKTGPALLARAFGYDGETDYAEWIDYNSNYPTTALSVLIAMAM